LAVLGGGPRRSEENRSGRAFGHAPFSGLFPLARQVRAATDHAINACGRLAGVELPTFANTEASIPELEERVAKTIDRQISRIRLSDKTSRLCFRVQRHLPATTSGSEWRRARQAGLHGNAAPTLAAAMCPRPVPGSGRIARMVRNDRWELI